LSASDLIGAQPRALQRCPCRDSANGPGDHVTSARQPPQVSGWLHSVQSRTSGRAASSYDSADLARAADNDLEVQPGVAERLLLRVRTDSLVRNSLYLVFSAGVKALFSFAFWIIAARLFTTDETGRASSLFSATTFLALLAMLGLNFSFVRYLPGAKNRDALITGGLAVVTLCGLVLGVFYVLAAPTIAPRLAFIERSLPLAIAFILFTGAASVNMLTDSIFVGSHKAGYVALTDGAIAGAAKIGAVVLLAGSGAFGLYCASTTGLAATAFASIILIAVPLGWRPKFRNSLRALRPLVRFSTANYASELLGLIPQSILPLIMLDRLGPSDAAYYFLSYQVASLTYATISAVQSMMLAEGGRAHVDLRNLVNRSTRLTLMMSLPVVLVVALCGHWILLVFGAKYSTHGTLALIVLEATALPLAANGLIDTMLRLVGQLKVLVWSSVLFAVAICGLAWFLAPHGLVAATAAWPISIAIATLPGGASLLLRRPSAARHRRTEFSYATPRDALSPSSEAQPDRAFVDVQQAGLAALLSLSIAGNTAPIAFRFADFDLPPVPPAKDREAAPDQVKARARHSSGTHSSGRRSQHASRTRR
jgi:O-antigen/teichoic acid export membrane protein